MERIRRSWRLVKASWAVLMADKELLVFPFLSFLATVMVTVVMLFPAYALGFVNAPGSSEEGVGAFGYVVLFLYYVVLYSLMFFFNTALVGATMIRLEGGDPKVSDGLDIAFKKMGAIMQYAVIAATVGMILRAVEERAGFVGRLVIGLIGLSWTMATYLTVPVLVTKNVTAIDAVKESADVFRRTWGEQMVANVGIGFATFLIFLLMALVSIPLIILASNISEVLLIPLVLSLLGGFFLLALVSSALKGIYSAALYRYATTGDAGEHFTNEMMDEAFRPRKKRW